MESLTKESLMAVWQMPVSEIAEKFGISKNAVYQTAKRLGLPQRGHSNGAHPADPSPETIAERAREVRAKWTPQEARSRLVGAAKKTARWTPPVVRVSEIEAPSFSRI